MNGEAASAEFLRGVLNRPKSDRYCNRKGRDEEAGKKGRRGGFVRLLTQRKKRATSLKTRG